MTFILLTGIYLCGGILAVLGLRDVPEGYEDESGFHLIWRNNHAAAADISCVWADLGQPVFLPV